MYAGKDNSPELGPVWAVIAGMALMITGSALDVLALDGLWKGEIWRLSKYHPGLAVRAESPGSFWFSVAFSLVFGLLLITISARILKEAWVKLHN